MMTIRITVAAALAGMVLLACGATAQTVPPMFLSNCSSASTPAPAGDAAPSLLPPVAKPLCGPVCWQWEGGTTPTEQGSGSTCSAATSSLTSQLTQIAQAACLKVAFGECGLVETITTSCHLVSGAYQVQGYATYGCRDTTC